MSFISEDAILATILATLEDKTLIPKMYLKNRVVNEEYQVRLGFTEALQSFGNGAAHGELMRF